MMALEKFGIGDIFSFCAALGTPYAAEVHALPSATSALTQGAPSMRANASRCPPSSMTANDMGGAPSSFAASRAAVHRLMASSRVSMQSPFVCDRRLAVIVADGSLH